MATGVPFLRPNGIKLVLQATLSAHQPVHTEWRTRDAFRSTSSHSVGFRLASEDTNVVCTILLALMHCSAMQKTTAQNRGEMAPPLGGTLGKLVPRGPKSKLNAYTEPPKTTTDFRSLVFFVLFWCKGGLRDHSRDTLPQH